MIGNFIRASLLALAAAVTAQADGPLLVEREAEQLIEVATGAGESERVLAPATRVQPGDEILYTVSFTNTGRALIAHATVTTEIPAGMRYVADSASGPGTEILFSVDGGANFAAPDELRFGPDAEQRPAAVEFYTDIRWIMRYPLVPGATAYARYRAVASTPARPGAASGAARRVPALFRLQQPVKRVAPHLKTGRMPGYGGRTR